MATTANPITTNLTVAPLLPAKGFLCWWTVHAGIYDVQKLCSAATQLDVPDALSDLLVGAEGKSAWLKATQLGAQGASATAPQPDQTARFLSRDVGQDLRAVVYEVIDHDEHLVATEQLALLGFDASDNTVTAVVPNAAALAPARLNELVALIEKMQSDLEARVGQIDDAKIRTALLRWLSMRHRVSLRNTGGVYFVPTSAASYEVVKDEMMAVRQWAKDLNVGIFSVVRLTDDGATSIADVQESAIQEIQAEAKEIAEMIATRAASNSSGGMLLYSAKTQLDKITALRAKAKALEESLGDIFIQVGVQLDLTEKQAKQFTQAAKQAAAEQKEEKKSGKTGTAQGRAKHRKL